MSDLFTILAWGFLPSLATRTVLTIYYRVLGLHPNAPPPPPPNSPTYQRTYKTVHSSVIVLYLLYTIYDAYHRLTSITPNLYTLLDVPITVPDKALRVQWRKLNLLYHPDKIDGGEDYFVILQQAYEVLSDPSRRFGYDRFGMESVTGWGRGLTGQKEYIMQGAFRGMPYYVGMGGFLLGLSVLGKLEYGRYWRFLAFSTLLVYEMFIATRTYNIFDLLPPVITSYLPFSPLLPFEQIVLARKSIIAFFIALSQLGPLLSPPTPSASSQAQNPNELVSQMRPYIGKLEALATVLDQQAGQVVMTEFMPFQGSEELVGRLEGVLEEYLIETQIRGDEGVRAAMGRAMRAMRRGARV